MSLRFRKSFQTNSNRKARDHCNIVSVWQSTLYSEIHFSPPFPSNFHPTVVSKYKYLPLDESSSISS